MKNILFLLLIFLNIKITSKENCIILICGTSSSGKSEIVKAFMKLYSNNFKDISGDDFLTSLFFYPKTDEEFEYARNKFYLKIKKILSKKNIIVDMVFTNDLKYQKFYSLFKKEKTLLILIYYPLDLIIERVKTRNSCNKKSDIRPAIWPFRCFSIYYKLTEKNEPIIDILNTNIIKESLQESIKYDLDNNILYLSKASNSKSKLSQESILLSISNKFSESFNLDLPIDTISISAKDNYDLIINGKDKTADQIAQEIFKKAKEKELL